MKNKDTIQSSRSNNHKHDLTAILSFVTEICEVPYAFISQVKNEIHVFTNQIGIELNSIPEEIALNISSVIGENGFTFPPKGHKVNNEISKDNRISEFHFAFFDGLPFYSEENLVIGSICIMDANPKVLSPIQLKTLKICAQQIQSILRLWDRNQYLQKTLDDKENELKLFFEGPKDIMYELDVEGNFVYVSDNWNKLLGHKKSQVLGKPFAMFVHPEDIEKCFSYLDNVIQKEKNGEEIEYRVLHKDGNFLWFISHERQFVKNESPIYIGTYREITKEIPGRNYIQQELYEKILDKIPTDIAVFDKDHRYIYLNSFAIRNDELRKFIIGKNDFEYAKHTGRNPLSAQKRREKFLEAAASRSIIEWEEKFLDMDGELTYHIRKFNPVLKEDGTLDIMVGFGNNITEIKNKELEILKSKQLLSSILGNVAVGILVQGPQSEIIENNTAACEMLGLTQEQLIGKTSFDSHWKVIHLDGTEFKPEEHPVPKAISQLKPIKGVIMGVHRPISNDMVWLLVDAIPVFDQLRNLLYVVCSFNDVTELKKIEDELKISNERFSYSSQATSDAIWDWNISTDEIFVGASYSEIFGHHFRNNIIRGAECENFVHPDDREAYLKHVDEVIESKATKWHDEYRYLKSDGSYADVNDKAIIIRNIEGKAIRMIGAMQDITNTKKLQNKLKQSEERFKGIFKHSPIGMALVDINGKYLEVNESVCEILGYSNEELETLTFQEITYPEDLKADLEFKEMLDNGKTSSFSSEKRFVKKNKSILWTHISVSIEKNTKNEIKYYIVQIIDISKRKQIEKENKLLIEENNKNKIIQLNEAKNLYRLLAENTVDLVCLHNLDASFQYISPSVKNLLGYEPEELIGKTPKDYVHPEDIDRFYEGLTNFIYKSEDNAQEFRFRNVNGDYLWLEITATIIEENGIPASFQSSARDITLRKEAKNSVEKALVKERELNELRTNLVSTISHEFRTPMTTIRTSAELITMYMEGNHLEKNQKIDKQLNTIISEIDRIIELMNSVLTISKDDSGKTNFNPILLDLKQLCLEVVDTSYANQKDGRKVQTYFEGNSFNIFADKNLMEYSLFNLLNNAFKYSDGSGDVVLQLSSNTSNIVLQIIDEGIGIPEEDQHKLFNTFFRASNTNGIQGTGLGLYIVKTFTEKNSGNIILESTLGKGTRVYLQFPIQKT